MGFVGYFYQAPLEILTSVTSLWERVYSVETAQLKGDEVEQGEPAQTLSEAVLQATLVEIQAISKCSTFQKPHKEQAPVVLRWESTLNHKR